MQSIAVVAVILFAKFYFCVRFLSMYVCTECKCEGVQENGGETKFKSKIQQNSMQKDTWKTSLQIINVIKKKNKKEIEIENKNTKKNWK